MKQDCRGDDLMTEESPMKRRTEADPVGGAQTIPCCTTGLGPISLAQAPGSSSLNTAPEWPGELRNRGRVPSAELP